MPGRIKTNTPKISSPPVSVHQSYCNQKPDVLARASGASFLTLQPHSKRCQAASNSAWLSTAAPQPSRMMTEVASSDDSPEEVRVSTFSVCFADLYFHEKVCRAIPAGSGGRTGFGR